MARFITVTAHFIYLDKFHLLDTNFIFFYLQVRQSLELQPRLQSPQLTQRTIWEKIPVQKTAETSGARKIPSHPRLMTSLCQPWRPWSPWRPTGAQTGRLQKSLPSTPSSHFLSWPASNTRSCPLLRCETTHLAVAPELSAAVKRESYDRSRMGTEVMP